MVPVQRHHFFLLTLLGHLICTTLVFLWILRISERVPREARDARLLVKQRDDEDANDHCQTNDRENPRGSSAIAHTYGCQPRVDSIHDVGDGPT